jgi:hypothetical protein
MFSRASLGPIWPRIQWVRGVLSPAVSSLGIKRAIRAPRLRIIGALLVLNVRPFLAYTGTKSLYLRFVNVFEVCSFCHVFVCNLAAEVRLFSRCLYTHKRDRKAERHVHNFSIWNDNGFRCNVVYGVYNKKLWVFCFVSVWCNPSFRSMGRCISSWRLTVQHLVCLNAARGFVETMFRPEGSQSECIHTLSGTHTLLASKVREVSHWTGVYTHTPRIFMKLSALNISEYYCNLNQRMYTIVVYLQ